MKLRKSSLLLIVALFSASALTVGCSKSETEKIVIKGSSTVLPITQKVAEAYSNIKKTRFSIEGSGSGNGIRAILNGTCDIANSSREMKEKELKKAKEKGLNIKEIVVAYDMIVPVVNPANPIKNITVDQLKAIYDGSISNWKELGGADKKIVVVSRDTSSGTYEVWEKKVMKKTNVRKDALLQATNGAVASVVSNNPNAIGYVGFGYLNEKMVPLKVNGIVGTLENGKSGKFPISRKLYSYINLDKTPSYVMDFINYLTGKEGQKLVQETGFISL